MQGAQYSSYKRTALLAAVREGRIDRVREVINSRGQCYVPEWGNEYSVLRIAVERKHIEIAKVLIRSGFKVNSNHEDPCDSLLHFAVLHGDTDFVQMLLDNGANINAKNAHGRTPLHNAVETIKTEIIGVLLNQGANIEAADNSGITPLNLAIENGSRQITSLLLSRGATVDGKGNNPTTSRRIAADTGDGSTPLHIAVAHGNKETTIQHLRNGANVDAKANNDITSLRIAWENTSISRKGYTPLHLAIEKCGGDIDELISLLSQGADVNARAIDGVTSLHLATQHGYSSIVDTLLEYGAFVNSAYTGTVRAGYTSLHIAAEKGFEVISKLLLSKGANVNAIGNDRMSPLLISIRAGHLNNAEVLLNHGANVNFTSWNSHAPLYFAIINSNEQMVKLLLESGAGVNVKYKTDKTVLILAVEKKNPIIVKQILKHSPDLNNKSNSSVLNVAVQGNGIAYRKIIEDLFEYGFTVNCEDENCMYAAIKNGHVQVVEEFLKHGTDVNTLYASTAGGSYIPLHVAIKKGHEEVAKLLITNGADVNALDETGRTPIFYAIDSGEFRIFKLLLTSNVDINDNPELLNIAVMGDHREIVEVLLQHGADVNASDQYGRMLLLSIVLDKDNKRFRFPASEGAHINAKGEVTKLFLSRGANANTRDKDGMPVLHAAIEHGYVKGVEALLEYDADVNVTYGGTTPLHISSKQGYIVISEMLLHKGANIHAVNAHGEMPLHCATRRNREEVVKLLLHGGADVNAKTEGDLITPLHKAALNGYEEIVKLLLQFNASVDSTEEHGETALHFASKGGHENIVTLLLGYGADITVKSKNHYTALDFATDGMKAFCCLNHSLEYYRDYDSSDCTTSTYINIAVILERHMIKMKAVNLNVQNDGRLSIESDDEELNVIDYTIGNAMEMLRVHGKAPRKERRLSRSKFHSECDREIASLKSEKVFDTNISFYDILTKDVGRVANYARNECVVKAFKLDDYTEKFPIYSSMITSNFKKGENRRMFLEKVNKIFDLIKDFPKLPRDCTIRILSYLKIDDLKALADAGEPIA